MSAPELLVCSHRGPLSFELVRGRRVARWGSGGLVNAVAPVLERFGGTWIAAALTEQDRDVAREHPGGIEQGGFRLRFLDLPPEAHRGHYEVVCNRHLWFLFHYLFDLPHTPRFDAGFAAAWEAYREVNRRYAEAVAAAGRADAVLVEDFHLLLVASELRGRGTGGGPLVYFHHVPWCEPDYFSLLPRPVGEEILRGALAHDVVGFHSTRWARAFLACCRRVLGADTADDRVRWEGREVRVLVAPAPLGAEQARARAAAPEVARWRERLEKLRAGRRVLLRVDRVELSKNVLRGFLAFEALLERRPELARDVWFVALVYPSRPRVAEYRRYLGSCLAAAHRLNERFGWGEGADRNPLGLFVRDDRHRSLAGMQLYDALLVNPVFDGLNLVAKEGPFLNEREGALILSRNAGVFEELGEAALGVNPFDVLDTAAAIERALEMPPEERGARAAQLRRLVTTGTPEGWVRGQLEAAGVSLVGGQGKGCRA